MNINPRMQKIVKYQRFAAVLNAVLTFWIATSVIGTYFPDSGDITKFFLGIVGGFVCFRLFNIISLVILQLYFYRGKTEEMIEDAEQALIETAPKEKSAAPTTQQVSVKIVNTPDKIHGRYMDAEFYEWIEIEKPDGGTVRCTFSGTLDMSKGTPSYIPPKNFLIPPGILYQVDGDL